MRTGMLGHNYIHELLESGNYVWIYQVFHMKYNTPIALWEWLLAHTILKLIKEVTVEEKLALFLHIVTRPISNRDIQEQFFYSGDTISQ